MSATNVGQISLDLILNSKEFDTKLNQKLNEVGKTTSNKLNSTFSKLGKTIAGAFAIGAIAKFGKECLGLGSDLQEVQNVVDSTFSTLNEKVNEYASESITKLGMSETAYKRYIGTMGAMSKSFGFTEEQALQMSKTLTELTGDVASFYNLSHDEAYTKMKAVFTGETESLKELGVVMTQAALDSFALANGYGKATSAMNEQEKVALRYAFVQDKLKTATGDFIRTQNGWANQTRILSQQFQALKSSIGQGLINALTPVIKAMNILLSKINEVAKGFAALTAKIFGDASGGSKASAAISSAVGDIGISADGASDSIGGIGDATAKAAKKANKALMGFDEINKLSSPIDTSAAEGAGGGAGAAIGGIGEGSSEALDEAIQKETIFEKALNKIIKRATELKNIFIEGFKFGLDATGFEDSIIRIKSSAAGIKEHFKDIFDAETGAAFSTMLDKIAKSLGEIGGAAIGAGVNLAANLLEGFESYLGLNKGTIKDTLILVFDEIGSAFERLSEILVPNMNMIVETAFKIVAGFLAAKVIIGVLAGITTAITSLAAVFTTLKSSLSFVTVGTKLFGAAFTALTSPVGIIVTAIAAAVAIMVVLYNKCEVFKNIVNNTFSVLAEKFQFFKDTLIMVGNSVKENLLPKFEEFGARIKEIWDTWILPAITMLSAAIMKIIEIVGSTLFSCLSDVAVILGNLANKFLPPLLDAISGVIEVVSAVAAAIAFVIEKFLDWIRTNETVMTVLRAVVDAILVVVGVIGTVSFVVANLPIVIAAAIALIVGYVVTNFDKIKNYISNFCDKIANWWNNLCSSISNWWTNLWNDVFIFFANKGNEIQTKIKSVIDFCKIVFEGWKKAISEDLEKIGNAVKNFSNNVHTWWTNLWTNVTNFFKTKINSIIEGALNGFRAIYDGASRIFNGLKDLVSGIFSSLVNLIKKPLNSAISLVNKAIDGLNNLSIDLPEFLGGGHIGFDIPKIPALANGGYLKPNQPTLAMVGDNRHAGEIVAPEDKMAEVFAAVLDKYFGNLNTNQNNNNRPIENTMIVQLDGKTIYKEMKAYNNKESNRTGSKQFR